MFPAIDYCSPFLTFFTSFALFQMIINTAVWFSSVQFIFYLINHIFWCRGCFDVCEDYEISSSPRAVDQENGRNEGESSGLGSILPRHAIPEHKYFLSGSPLAENAVSPKRVVADGDR